MNDVTKDLLKAMRIVAQMAEDLKKPCGTNPESPQAIRNAQYMNISYAARSAIARAEASLATPQPDADGWIPWSGGECPVPRYTIVEIMFRGGHKTRTYAGNMSWMHYGLDADIVAYRIVTEALNDWT